MAIKITRGAGDQPPAPEKAASPGVREISVPIDVGMYDTVSVIDALEYRYPIPSFIKDTFFAGRDYIASDVVQIDVRKGGKQLAPFILPMEGQVIGRRRPFMRTMLEAPAIAPARVITLREISKPWWGENTYDFYTPEQRLANMMADDIQDMDEEITRTEEWMCCQCMFLGQIPIHYRTQTDVILDYGFTNITAVALPWTDPTALPLDDLHAAQQGMNANGYSGNIAIYGTEAWKALWNNPSVKDTLKNLSGWVPMTGGYNMPELLPAGVAVCPAFTYPVMKNYIYAGTYVVAEGGPAVPLVPPDRVLIGSSDTKNRLIYAMVSQIEQTDGKFHSYMSDRVPKYESNVNKNLIMNTLTSRPVPVPIDLLSWTVLTGVV